MIINFLKKVPKILKKKTIDEDMCICVKKLTSETIDNIWPDIEDEIMFQFRLQLNKPIVANPPPPPPSWFCCCCIHFRACFRYNYMPIDMSIWKRIKTFGYWIIMAFQIFPFYSV